MRTRRFIHRDKIDEEVSRLAIEISNEYKKKEYLGVSPTLLGVLKGSFVFMADLIRKLNLLVKVDFIKASSYEGLSRMDSTYMLGIHRNLPVDVKGKHILVVEDIVDTGLTMDILLNALKKEAATVKLCSLLNKPSRRKANIKIDFCGMEITDEFVIGYGMDYDGLFRDLADIHVLDYGQD